MTLPKSIQPKNNKSYDGLITVVTDLLVCAKLKFAEMLSWKFNKFLRGFQTDNPMVPFFYVTLEGLLQWLMEKFILKETQCALSVITTMALWQLMHFGT